MRKLLILFLIIILSVSNISAISKSYIDDGYGTWVTEYWVNSNGHLVGDHYLLYDGCDLPSYYSRSILNVCADGGAGRMRMYKGIGMSNWISICYQSVVTNTAMCESVMPIGSYNDIWVLGGRGTGGSTHCLMSLTISPFTIYEYTISGDICGVTTSLSVKDGDDNYIVCEINDSLTHYSYKILNNTYYRLDFSDGYEYEFFCDNESTIYNYDGCIYVYGYTCHIDWVRLYKDVAGVWEYEGLESQSSFDFDEYEFLITNGENYKINFSDGHEYIFSCSGNHIMYDHDICVWVCPPSPYQKKEMIPWIVGFDNNVVLMKDNHGNFIENSQTAIYNKDTQTYIQKWRDTPEPYILLANNTDSNDEVIVMCKTFDGIFVKKTFDPIFGTNENITWCNWTIPIMYNLNLIPINENKCPLHDVFISMYEYTPTNPLSFHGYDSYWGYIPIHNCSGFSRCDIKSEKIGYNDCVSTGLNWTSKNAMVKDYKHNINMVKTS